MRFPVPLASPSPRTLTGITMRNLRPLTFQTVPLCIALKGQGQHGEHNFIHGSVARLLDRHNFRHRKFRPLELLRPAAKHIEGQALDRLHKF